MTDRELLGIDLDDIYAELDRYIWGWVNMGDDRVCPDCERLASLPPAPMSEWVSERTEPGRGDTICEDHCRCAMVADDIIKLFPDLKTEGKIVIDNGLLAGEVSPLGIDYKIFDELDDLIVEFKTVTGNKKLPAQYYKINTVQGRIDLLNDYLDLHG